jgi:hypothetical protein
MIARNLASRINLPIRRIRINLMALELSPCEHRTPKHGTELSMLIKSIQIQAEVMYFTPLICIEATTIPR